MGIFEKLFKKSSVKNTFNPDLRKTEYENWLTFLECGGTSEEWKELKRAKQWKFKNDETENTIDYERQFRPIFNQYYEGAKRLKEEWSVLYNAKTYMGEYAEQFEENCLQNIADYKALYDFEQRHKKEHMTSAEGYKRIVMLYEKQGKMKDAIEYCTEACALGLNEQARLERLLKKQERER